MSQALKDNLGFVGICLAIFAGLFLQALAYERLAMKNRRKLSSTHYMTYTAIFSCLAGVLMLMEIPLFFAPSFYKADLSEIPVLICTFYLGPVAGVTCELIKVIVKLVLKGTTSSLSLARLSPPSCRELGIVVKSTRQSSHLLREFIACLRGAVPLA